MEQLIVLRYPREDIEGIQSIVQANESIISLLNGDVYQIFHYLTLGPLKNFTAVVNRNFYTRITALVRNELPQNRDLSDFRWAAAVLAFLQIAEVKFFASSSLQEYASARGGEAAVEEIKAFRVADDTDPKHWIDFALGRTNKIDNSKLASPRSVERTPTPAEYEAIPRQFESNRACVLKIALLSLESCSPKEKVIKLIEWMYADFMFVSPALLFANIYFSPSRRSKMLKGYDDKSIRNATWDLTLAQFWRQYAIKGVQQNEPVLLITRDKALKDIAIRFTAETDDEFRAHLANLWGQRDSSGKEIHDYYLLREKDVVKDREAGRRKRPTLAETRVVIQSLEAELSLRTQTVL
jgi:hypothetical protein